MTITPLPKPRRVDRKAIRFDTTTFLYPKPEAKAKAMSLEIQAMPKREESAKLRREVYARDKGVCSLCGLDTEALSNQWLADVKADLSEHLCNICDKVTPSDPCIHCSAPHCGPSFRHRNEFRAMLEELGFSPAVARKYNGATLWQADHELAVHEGGGGLGPDNGRTLCLKCHAKVNAQQAETRKLRRRHAR